MKLHYSFLLLVMMHTTYPMKRTMDLADIVEPTIGLENILNTTSNTAPLDLAAVRAQFSRIFEHNNAQCGTNHQPQRQQEQHQALVQVLQPLVAPRAQQQQRKRKLTYHYHLPTAGGPVFKFTDETQKAANNVIIHNNGNIQSGVFPVHVLFDIHKQICRLCGRYFVWPKGLARHLKNRHHQS
jgi:hypothetical protein